MLASILSAATGRHFSILIAAVFAGAAVNVCIIAVLSHRFYQSDPNQPRFTIGTLMLMTIALSTYLAYISNFIPEVTGAELSFGGGLRFAIYALIFFVVTTIILIRFTEALIAVALILLEIIKF